MSLMCEIFTRQDTWLCNVCNNSLLSIIKRLRCLEHVLGMGKDSIHKVA